MWSSFFWVSRGERLLWLPWKLWISQDNDCPKDDDCSKDDNTPKDDDCPKDNNFPKDDDCPTNDDCFKDDDCPKEDSLIFLRPCNTSPNLGRHKI